MKVCGSETMPYVVDNQIIFVLISFTLICYSFKEFDSFYRLSVIENVYSVNLSILETGISQC